MLTDNDGKRCLPCPHRVAQDHLQLLPYKCNGIGAKTMSSVRQHMRRNHSMFLKLCGACNADILNEDEYKARHGDMCRTPQNQRRRSGQDYQWHALYDQIEALVVSGGMTQRALVPIRALSAC